MRGGGGRRDWWRVCSCHLDAGAISDLTADPSTPEGARLVHSQNVSPASSFGSPPSLSALIRQGLQFHNSVCSGALGPSLVLLKCFYTAFALPFSTCVAGLTSASKSFFVLFLSSFTWQIIEAANLGTNSGG